LTTTLRKKKSELLTKETERKVAYAISVFMEDEKPNHNDWRTEAKTVLSAFVVGQAPMIAAQRLLSWDCVDNGIPEENLSEVSKERGDPFIRIAFGGYFCLNGLSA
jgi:hypothetical protein